MHVEQRDVVSFELQPPLFHSDRDVLQNDEVIAKDCVGAIPTHEKVVNEVVIPQLYRHPANALHIQVLTISHLNPHSRVTQLRSIRNTFKDLRR